MEIIYKKLTDIRPYEKNPRKNDEAVKYVANSIKASEVSRAGLSLQRF